MADPPKTLPADFFSRPREDDKGPPATLPADFFDRQEKAPTWGERLWRGAKAYGKEALQEFVPDLTADKELLQGVGAGVLSTGAHVADIGQRLLAGRRGVPEKDRFLNRPQVRAAITPPSSTAGQIGFGGEQAAEYFLPIGPEIKGAGLLRGAARVGKEALRSGLIGGLQTGTREGAITSGALGGGATAAAEAAAPLLRKVAPKIYQRALGPAKKYSLEQRAEMTKRGLAPQEPIPLAESSLPKLQKEIDLHKDKIERITKNAASPYAQRSIPIQDVLQPLEDFVKKIEPADKEYAAQLRSKLGHWKEGLGYQPPTPARQVPTGLFDANGNPHMRTVAAQPGNAMTTVAKAQELKEAFNEVISSSVFQDTATEPGVLMEGRAKARKGMKQMIEKAIPEEPVARINGVIENDIHLKEAVEDAIKRKPQWLGETAMFVLGETAVEALHRATGRDEKADFTVPLIGALTMAAARNPGAQARLAIALQRAGIAMPKLARALPAGAAAARGAPEAETPPQAPAPTSAAPQAGPPQAAARGRGDYRQALTAAGERHGVPPAVLHAVAQIESGGNPRAVSGKGATGLMQLMPATARQYGVRNIHDVFQNIEGSARLLSHLWRKYEGNLPLVLAAYNAGEGAVDKYGGVPPFRETREYVRRGLSRMRQAG